MVTTEEIDGIDRRFFAALAVALSYPGPALLDYVREAEALAPPEAPEAGRLLGRFRQFVEAASPGHLEETYTATFELQAMCPPYIGFHLFGESYKRSMFLVGLRKSCREYGVEPDTELPDHIAPILHLLSACTDAALVGELIDQAIVPGLSRMIGGKGAPDPGVERQFRSDAERLDERLESCSPYVFALTALKRVLEARPYRSAAQSHGEGLRHE